MPLPSSSSTGFALTESTQRAQENLRKERLAINLADLDRLDPEVRARLFGGRLDLTAPIRLEGYHDVAEEERVERVAIPLVGTLLAAACACDALRSQDRQSGSPVTRVYLNRGSSWNRLTSDDQLADIVDDGQGGVRAVLSPRLFPEPVNPVPLTAPPQQVTSRFRR